ncbi:MAG: hydrogenase maturation protease [Chloroflexi bacterium]|nr:hydrogenase maturation protease [Chloroflexota bacterium]
MRTLILGYGNTLRKDDGLGVYAAQALASLPLPDDVEIRTCQQLSPELSPTLAQVDHAIFIDAALASNGEKPGTINTRILHPKTNQPSGITHHFDPETLLAMAESLYGHAPQATLFSVVAASFDLEEGLSSEANAALPVLIGSIKKHLLTIL